MFISIPDTIIIHKEITSVTQSIKLGNIIPPISTNAIFISIMFPNANTTKAFLYDISARNSTIEIIIGIGSAISSMVCTEAGALVIAIRSFTVRSYAIIYVKVRSEICTFAERRSDVLKAIKKRSTKDISWYCPKVIFNTIVRSRKCPSHLELNRIIILYFSLQCICINFKHKKRRNRNILSRSVIRHYRFRCLTHSTICSSNTFTVCTKTYIICYNNSCSSSTLCIANLLNKCASTTINH
mmetsp:Transcript_21435/g.23784  ORF Transcript_21435/g.23784 Transcript_21435/m.23784 type:complete len:241 (+) Transcript_21435:714-1436(+)